jgi:hypothetical protein
LLRGVKLLQGHAIDLKILELDVVLRVERLCLHVRLRGTQL